MLVFALYWVGLRGPFLLDDAHNIQPLILGQYTPASVWYAINHNTSGLLSRAVSALSLLVTGAVHGASAWGFKFHNLLIHVALTWLLLGLTARVLSARWPRTQALWVAGVAVAVWAVHPLQVSTVLYPVQRMAQLVALFTVVGLYAFVVGMEAARTGHRHWAAVSLWLGYPAALALAVFSKESGVLLLPLTLVVWWFAVPRGTRFSAEWVCHGEARQVRWFLMALVVMPIAIGALYFVTHLDRFLNYDGRSFSLHERVLTQVQVVWMYIKFIVWPRLGELGLYHDDIAIVRSFSVRTGLGLAAFAAAGALAWWQRHRWPVVALGFAWFVVCHLLESTVLPLEIAFEHRNYLASFGLLLVLSSALSALPRTFVWLRPVSALVVLASLALMAHTRAQVWSHEGALHEITVQDHPRSARARSYYANYLIRSGEMEQGRAQLRVLLSELMPDSPAPALHLLETYCRESDAAPEPLISDAQQRLERSPMTPYALNAMNSLLSRSRSGRCNALTMGQIHRLVEAAVDARVPGTSMALLYRLHAQSFANQGQLHEAYRALDAAAAVGAGVSAVLEKADLALGADDLPTATEELSKAVAASGWQQAESFRIDRLQRILDKKLLAAAEPEPEVSTPQ
ncbi:MAG: hypothetical protein SV583_08830 [Pseudomonadota bacterium]|nr:hypothetical protein [Pseudomonadota bacterium]